MNFTDLLQFQQPIPPPLAGLTPVISVKMIIPRRSISFSRDECMLTSHNLLLKFWHDSRYNFSGVGVEYVDRGAPDDRSAVSGRDIRLLDAYYFEIISEQGVKYIPYHRIRRLMYNGRTVWER